MKDRKLHVIHLAHELFIEKGFQATSIQDILSYTGISKGTFYNYFSSKAELLMAIFKDSYKLMEKERDALLIGKSPQSIDVFKQQVEQQVMFNHKHQLISLFDEMFISDDIELKAFIRKGQLQTIKWIYYRFIDLFGENRRAYLLDMSIIFLGILHQLSKYYTELFQSSVSITKVVQYSVERIVEMTNQVATKEVQLFSPSLIDTEINDLLRTETQDEIKYLCELILETEALTKDEELLIQFIQDELLLRKKPRKFLIDSALETLKRTDSICNKSSIIRLQSIVHNTSSPS
ncbi:TetR/AcrR family transcriptional regulator [Cytobacillus sp. FSL R7-0680]|uniref:TetR/AcrR family transcriptional regulator n=1 Tax=Cytobacillus sp. FSL R7-0680 TaxID=2921689 RepID=UPI0030F5DEB5